MKNMKMSDSPEMMAIGYKIYCHMTNGDDEEIEGIVRAVTAHDKLVEALERIESAPIGTLHRTIARDALLAIKGDQE